MIYLASAYTNFDRKVMHENYERTVAAVARLLHAGHFIYSPIVHCHPAAIAYALPHEFHFWIDYNHDFIDASEAVWVLCDIDWSNSKGVAEEIAYCDKIKKPIRFVYTADGNIKFSPHPIGPKFIP